MRQATKELSAKPVTQTVFRCEKNPTALVSRLAEIRVLADLEKEALGFIPEGAYRDAILQRRLVAMMSRREDANSVAGFILFGGVFPHARIQQLVVAEEHRKAGIASALVSDLIAHLEARGFLTVSAAVASDLDGAQAFYERKGFIARQTRPGGVARGRMIVLRVRDLDTASLFSLYGGGSGQGQAADLGLRQRSASVAPLYAIDLNVLFDLLRSRERTRLANRLFGAALAHQIRLAVAPEFLVELERTSFGTGNDPTLLLARQMPRLPALKRDETARLAELAHDIIFVRPGVKEAGTSRAISDSRHIAEAALARASCYVTSDTPVLNGRDALLEEMGIDIASLDEFDSLLPQEVIARDPHLPSAADFQTKPLSPNVLRSYLTEHSVAPLLVEKFAPIAPALEQCAAIGIFEADEMVGAACRIGPSSIGAPCYVAVHVRPGHINCELFADYLLDLQCREASTRGPATIELPHIAGQSTVRRAAAVKGFLKVTGTDTLVKVAIGRPITASNWRSIAKQTRRRTGLHMGEEPPTAARAASGFAVTGPDGKQVQIALAALEGALGPTIIAWPGREGVIVPIARGFADDLLGTGAQLPLFGKPRAAFVARRTYFNSPRAEGVIRAGMPIVFYESRRSGGRGAAVAAAVVTDVTVVPKQQVSNDMLRRAVVDDVEPLSTSEDVLATTFESVLPFPAPVTLETLRGIGAVGTTNLQTATELSASSLQVILEHGWPS
jgi:GNAT superfamily N-acetyltransferase